MARKPFKLDAMSVAELLQLRDELQTALSGKIQMERDELQQKLDELAQMESGSNGAAPAKTSRGKRVSRKNGAAAARGRKPSTKRPPVFIRYYDPETGKTYSNRGPMATWLREKQEAGQDIEKKYRVSASNPLPKKLAHLTPPK
jgi:DNA-binding protein H-NS